MDVIKTEADWHPELNANQNPAYLCLLPFLFASGQSARYANKKTLMNLSVCACGCREPNYFINLLPSIV